MSRKHNIKKIHATGTGIPREFRDESTFLPLSGPRSPVTERYRRIKTHLDHLGERQGREIGTVVISSSRENEGKTLTAMNLALVLAEDRDRSVVLVDGDLHRPSLGRTLHRPPRIGLMDVYEERADLDSVVVPLVKSRLHILPAGRVDNINPAEILKSARFREIMTELRKKYQRVVIDSPPVMRFVDANILNEHADGMVFVVRAGLTSRQMVQKAIASVTSGPILGMVMNDVRYTVVDRYYYRYDEYGADYDE